MKKTQVLTLVCMVLALLSTAGAYATGRDASGEPTIEVFINDHVVNVSKDSVEITAKGTLRLTGVSSQSEQLSPVKFRIQIRHRVIAGGWQLMPMVEEYQSGKHFSTLQLEELLSKAKPGDQIVLIPIEQSPKCQTEGKPILLSVIGDRC